MASASFLSKLSTDELQAELRRRRQSLGGLHRKRGHLLAKLAKIEAEIDYLGDTVAAGRRGGRLRARNDVKLPQALHKLLAGRTMSVTEATEAVQRAGFRTNAASFRVMVNMALAKNTNLFKRVGRGQYTAK